MSRTISNVTPAGRVGLCAFTLIFVVVGLIFMRSGINQISKAKASVNWPQSDGRIVSSEAEPSLSNNHSAWYAQIVYSYIVDGIEMKGNQVAFGDYGSSNMSHAQKIVGQYPVGKAVKVYYNPKDCTECLLEPGMHGQTYGMLGFGFIFFAVGSIIFVAVLKIPIAGRNKTNNPLTANDVEES